METNFKVTEDMIKETIFGVVDNENGVNMEVTLGFKDKTYGYFEFYDEETGGEEWYAEGGIWFEGKDVVDYDGVFELPTFIQDKLIELGFNLDNL